MEVINMLNDKIKNFRIVGILVLAILILYGSMAFSAEPQKLLVGFASWTMRFPWNVIDGEELQAKVDEINAQGKYEIELKITDAAGKREKFLSDIEDLLAQDVDILMAIPMDAHDFLGWKDLVEKHRKETGKPLVYASSGKIPWGGDIDTEAMGVDFAIASMDFNDGKAIGEHFVAYLFGKKGKYEGKVAELRGVPGTGPDALRNAGFHSIIDQYPDIETVFDQTFKWSRMEAFQLTRVILQKFEPGTLDAIFAYNDGGGMGVLEAVTEAGREGEFLIYSHDGQSDVIRAIQEGKIAATAVFDRVAQKCLVSALDFLEGKKVEKVMSPPVIFITQGNVNKILEPGGYVPFIVGEDVHWDWVNK